MASFLKSILLLIQLSGQALALPYYDDPPALTTTSVSTQASFERPYGTLAVSRETNSTKTSFMLSCEGLALDRTNSLTKSPRLSANCRQLNGSTRCASINLSNCIASRGGTLRWERDGNFHTSCWGCALYGINPGSITCKCYKGNDTVDYTSIWLPGFMSNENGRLACEGYKSQDSHCPSSK